MNSAYRGRLKKQPCEQRRRKKIPLAEKTNQGKGRRRGKTRLLSLSCQLNLRDLRPVNSPASVLGAENKVSDRDGWWNAKQTLEPQETFAPPLPTSQTSRDRGG